MAGAKLRFRVRRADVVVELDGDAPTVERVLDGLLANGFGRLFDPPRGGEPGPPPPTPPGPDGTVTPLPQPARSLTFAIGSLRLPVTATDHGVDPDADGTARNRLGEVVGTFTAQGFDLQPWLDETAAADGDTVLVRLDTQHADLDLDQRADVTISAGRAVGAAVALDPSAPSAIVHGELRSGRFVGAAPAADRSVLRLPLALTADGPRFVTLRAPEITFTIADAGTRLVDGRLGGAADAEELAAIVSTGLAVRMTQHIAADPASDTARLLSAMFDVGGDQRPDGSAAVAGDGEIEPGELLGNPVVRAAFTPDVQVGDIAGVSVGLGFEADAVPR